MSKNNSRTWFNSRARRLQRQTEAQQRQAVFEALPLEEKIKRNPSKERIYRMKGKTLGTDPATE